MFNLNLLIMAKSEKAQVAQFCYPFGSIMDEAYSDVIIRREAKYKDYPLEDFDMIPLEFVFRREGVPIWLVTLGYISEIPGPSKHGNVLVTKFKEGEILCSNFVLDKDGDFYGTLYREEYEAEMNLSQVLACKREAETVWEAFLERDDDSAVEFIEDPFDEWYD